MLWVTTYEFRDNLEHTKENIAELMTLFAQRGEAPGTFAHYVRADGNGGVVLSEQDDAMALYDAALAYQRWLKFTVTPVVKIDDAVPSILASLA